MASEGKSGESKGSGNKGIENGGKKGDDGGGAWADPRKADAIPSTKGTL